MQDDFKIRVDFIPKKRGGVYFSFPFREGINAVTAIRESRHLMVQCGERLTDYKKPRIIDSIPPDAYFDPKNLEV